MLSTDGANKKPLMPLAQSDYMTNNTTTNTNSSYCGTGFADFHPVNVDFDNFLPQGQSQTSPSSMFPAEWNGHAQEGSIFSDAVFNHVGNGNYPQPQVSSSSFIMSSTKPGQYGCIDFESLQQKISLKKQSLDILQGVIPDPLGLEANHEKKAYMTNTERIQVPSSDHVAEIVGKNGQRIKQLREQLKVWVKTPSRDEPPIFEVTGLPEKLAEAKCHILRMSEHFTKVQQERMQRTEPNRMEDRLYVEQDKVGLIVGANGQTIRWVQQLSDTHIATPRKQESFPGLPPPQTYFTICGATDKVKFAKQLICEYVTLRCQGLWLDPDLEPSAEASKLVRDFHQRRQVEDTQRKTTVGPSNGGGGGSSAANGPAASVRPAAGSGIDAISKYAVSSSALPTSRGAGGSIGGFGDFAGSGNGGGASAASVRQLINDMEDMWSRCSISDQQNNSTATAATTGNSSINNNAPIVNPLLMSAVNASAWYPPPPQQQPPAASLYSMSDRRYSSADLTNAAADDAGFGGYGNPQQQQQQIPPMPVGPGFQQQQQLPAMKKSVSEEQVSPQLVGPGWM
ncbi:hypothetical protein BOX15_Mlig003787g1 [Macrostomum lignano]|uniref:Uncharacterized protein n=2 Tax=Macrostomum lignano TaxID=282301 RepID=A0A267GZZ7_9PLAT|nr:hypothetical protein BOX15_Mlig003787g1 [Macrostomum lignano]